MLARLMPWVLFLLVMATNVTALVDDGNPPMALVARTPKGNIVLRCATWLIFLNPKDASTFAPHVGKWVGYDVPRPSSDVPPEPVGPGDLFAESGVRLIRAMPDTGLELSLVTDRRRYRTGEPVYAKVTLSNVSANDIRLTTEHPAGIRPSSTVQVIIWLRRIGKWDKPVFRQIAQLGVYYYNLPAGERLVGQRLDISSMIDGPASYRVSATYRQGEACINAPFTGIEVEEKTGQPTAGADGTPPAQP